MNRGLNERIRVLEKREQENSQNIQTVADTMKDDQEALYENLNSAIKDSANRLDILAADSQKVHDVLDDLRKKTASDASSIKDLHHKVAHFEETVKHQNHELNNKLGEAKNQTGSLKEALRVEIQNVMNSQAESSGRLEELYRRISERAEAGEVAAQKRHVELEDLLNQVQQEFQVRGNNN